MRGRLIATSEAKLSDFIGVLRGQPEALLRYAAVS